jgi:hypothetical protein
MCQGEDTQNHQSLHFGTGAVETLENKCVHLYLYAWYGK